MPWVESWLYAGLLGVDRIRLQDTGPTVDLRLSASATLTDALADWETQANAHVNLTETYSFSRALDPDVVTISATGTFSLTLMDSTNLALGYSSTSHTLGTIYSSDVQPHAFATVSGASFDVPQPFEDATLREYRHGRSDAWVHTYGRWTNVGLWFVSSLWLTLEAGPLVGGKMRIHCSASAQPFGIDETDGYLDCYPQQGRAIGTRGQAETITTVDFVATLDN